MTDPLSAAQSPQEPREFKYGELGSVTAVTDAAERVMRWYDHHEPWNPSGDFKALRLALDAFEAARWNDREELDRLVALSEGSGRDE